MRKPRCHSDPDLSGEESGEGLLLGCRNPILSYPMPRYVMPEDLKHTPLHPSHRALDAHMIPFAGWERPARYASTVREHHAFRGSTNSIQDGLMKS